MKNFLFISILLMANISLAQLNPNFVKQEEKAFDLTQLNTIDLKLDKAKLSPIVLNTNPMLQFIDNNIGLTNDIIIGNDGYWMGQQQTNYFMLNNKKVISNHFYDINGNLKQSSMTIKLGNN